MTPKRNDPKPPSHLTAQAAKWFASVIHDYELQPHHVRLLTLACEAWDRCQMARKVLDKNGLTFLDFRDQPKARPENGIERDSRIGFARLVRELGLDVQEPDDPRPPRLGGRQTCR